MRDGRDCQVETESLPDAGIQGARHLNVEIYEGSPTRNRESRARLSKERIDQPHQLRGIRKRLRRGTFRHSSAAQMYRTLVAKINLATRLAAV
jgi:hypothetical protein